MLSSFWKIKNWRVKLWGDLSIHNGMRNSLCKKKEKKKIKKWLFPKKKKKISSVLSGIDPSHSDLECIIWDWHRLIFRFFFFFKTNFLNFVVSFDSIGSSHSLGRVIIPLTDLTKYTSDVWLPLRSRPGQKAEEVSFDFFRFDSFDKPLYILKKKKRLPVKFVFILNLHIRPPSTRNHPTRVKLKILLLEKDSICRDPLKESWLLQLLQSLLTLSNILERFFFCFFYFFLKKIWSGIFFFWRVWKKKTIW